MDGRDRENKKVRDRERRDGHLLKKRNPKKHLSLCRPLPKKVRDREWRDRHLFKKRNPKKYPSLPRALSKKVRDRNWRDRHLLKKETPRNTLLSFSLSLSSSSPLSPHLSHSPPLPLSFFLPLILSL